MKKIHILILLFLLFIPVFVNAESIQTGKFKYMPAFEDETEEVYYYSDNYFKESGKIDNEHLLAMSYNLALSTFEIRGCSYSKTLLEEIGFEDFQAFDMEEKPTLDTIGMVIAHKKVNGKDLIVVLIRGEKYDSEWGNNFIVGKNGNAKGFNDSSIKVINRIKDYIQNNNLGNNKIWIAGYSRAGTIADLTGVYINNHLSEFNTSENDLYIYTFEAPAASIDDTIYDNIYTVRSVNDLIPFVYPKEWGFHTNGKIINIGDDKQKIATYKGFLSQEEFGEVDVNTFINDFFTWLPSRLSREDYSNYIEEPVSKILDIYFSKNDSDRAKLLEFLTDELKPVIVEKIDISILDIFERNSDSIYKNITSKVLEGIESLENSDNIKVLTTEELQTIKDAIYPIFRVLGPIVVDDYYYFDGIDYDTYYAKYYPQFVLEEADFAYKNGKETGYSRGYSDAEYDDPEDNTVPEWLFQEDDTETYKENFTIGYQETYHDGYELGLSHKNNPEAKGRYDGITAGKEIGYRAGSEGKTNEPNPDDYYSDPYWIGTETECDYELDEYCESEKIYNDEDLEYLEKYKTNYYVGFNEGWNEGYPEGKNDGPNHGMEKSMYHFATIIKNVSTLLSNHHPQENLKLIHAYDSYYSQYNLTEGANQTVINDDDQKDNLVFKTSGHLEKLVKVQVDEKDLNPDDYESKSGSTIVTLKDSFIKTLSSGTHTLKMIYIDNTIETTFMIKKNNTSGQSTNTDGTVDNNETNPISTDLESLPNINNPGTGDNIMLYVTMLILNIIGLVGIILIKRKRFS